MWKINYIIPCSKYCDDYVRLSMEVDTRLCLIDSLFIKFFMNPSKVTGT